MCLERVKNLDVPITEGHPYLYPAGYLPNKSEPAG